MPMTNLNTNDAVELAELLQFLHDWFAADPPPGFVDRSTTSSDAGPTTSFNCADLNRFTFLIGASDGEGLFIPNSNNNRFPEGNRRAGRTTRPGDGSHCSQRSRSNVDPPPNLASKFSELKTALASEARVMARSDEFPRQSPRGTTGERINKRSIGFPGCALHVNYDLDTDFRAAAELPDIEASRDRGTAVAHSQAAVPVRSAAGSRRGVQVVAVAVPESSARYGSTCAPGAAPTM